MKQVYLIFLLSFLLLLSSGIVSSIQTDYIPLKQNTDFSLVISSNNATECNWTYLQYPNGSKTFSNIVMNQNGRDFDYTIDAENFTQQGITCLGITCQDGNQLETGSVCRNVTGNGNDNPDGFVVVLFILIFLLLLGSVCYLALYSLGHLIKLDFTIIDMAIDFGVYFMIVGLYLMEEFYLGNNDIRDYLLWFLYAGGILLVFIPIIAFILSMTMGTIRKNNAPQIKINQPPKYLWRRK